MRAKWAVSYSPFPSTVKQEFSGTHRPLSKTTAPLREHLAQSTETEMATKLSYD